MRQQILTLFRFPTPALSGQFLGSHAFRMPLSRLCRLPQRLLLFPGGGTAREHTDYIRSFRPAATGGAYPAGFAVTNPALARLTGRAGSCMLPISFKEEMILSNC